MTKKLKNEDRYYIIINEDVVELHAIKKLGKIEDIEEQLGCPLEVAFKKCEELEKQNKYSFYCICKLYDNWVILEIDIFIIDEIECNIVYYLADYQKTWWLKGEKEVNNE